MQIEMERGASLSNGEILYTVKKSTEKQDYQTIVCGLCQGHNIWLAEYFPLDVILDYTHEYGHFRGKQISFSEKTFLFGKTKNILTFDEIKENEVSVDLSSKEIAKLSEYLVQEDWEMPSWEQVSTGNKLLTALFRGKFSFDEINVYAMSQKQMRDKVKKSSIKGLRRKGRKVFDINSKAERNSELPAVYVEAACRLILENTMRKYGILEEHEELVQPKVSFASGQQRAQNIVAKAFYGRGWRLPSMVDLKRR